MFNNASITCTTVLHAVPFPCFRSGLEFDCSESENCKAVKKKTIANMGDNRFNCFECDYSLCKVCLEAMEMNAKKAKRERDIKNAAGSAAAVQKNDRDAPDVPPAVQSDK